MTRFFRRTATAGAILLGWCAMMAAYGALYDSRQRAAMPLALPMRVFMTDLWDQGYFKANGSYQNDSALDDGDQLIPQSLAISCIKSQNQCSIASAEIFGNLLNVDMENHEIEKWDDRFILFSDNSPVCVNQLWSIDRKAETLTLTVRRKSETDGRPLPKGIIGCNGIVDKNISLVDGERVRQQRIAEFDRRSGYWLIALLAFINIAYFGSLIWIWRRRQKAQPRVG